VGRAIVRSFFSPNSQGRNNSPRASPVVTFYAVLPIVIGLFLAMVVCLEIG
jgi:hypothetical protein